MPDQSRISNLQDRKEFFGKRFVCKLEREQFFHRHESERAGGAGADARKVVVAVAKVALIGSLLGLSGFERDGWMSQTFHLLPERPKQRWMIGMLLDNLNCVVGAGWH